MDADIDLARSAIDDLSVRREDQFLSIGVSSRRESLFPDCAPPSDALGSYALAHQRQNAIESAG